MSKSAQWDVAPQVFAALFSSALTQVVLFVCFVFLYFMQMEDTGHFQKQKFPIIFSTTLYHSQAIKSWFLYFTSLKLVLCFAMASSH